ncbi:MAG TPA: PASTA domain-containing protein, partial [Gaiellaceae bacterium]|nr:PASTA domain-containing protein [Gaiellaceae bacterium]
SGAKPGLVLSQRPAAAAPVRRPGRVLVTVGRAAPKPRPKPRPVAPPPPAPRTAIVASVVGLDRRTAAEALLAEGYGVRVYGVPSPAPAGRVVAQSPRPGTKLAAGEYVRVNVSAG